ncbi:MAG TPA: hypothetical protein VIF11_13275 [Methylomirabilota bacterium]
MVVGLVTLAIVGMLQTLVRVDPASVDPTWKSDVAGEDERGHVAGRAPSTPDAAGPIASNIMGRGGPARETLGDRSVSAAGLRPPSSQSRAPPILLSLASRA